MQFKHPELLYALFLLLIPIIIHLFQLRRFQKVAFTNVAFLKKVVLQTRKSSQLKKWLVLILRLGAIAAIVIAFAQPFSASKTALNTKKETVIYLDNSFSMEAKGANGALLQRAKQDLFEQLQEGTNVSFFTNNSTYKNASVTNVKNELLKTDYTHKQLSPAQVTLKAQQLFSKNTGADKRLVYISDFQQSNSFPEIPNTIQVDAVQLKAIDEKNIALDSVYISAQNQNTTTIEVALKASKKIEQPISVSLYNDNELIAKSAANFIDNTSQNLSFDFDHTNGFKGKIVLNDGSLNYDNTLYFSINKPEKIKVLAINNANEAFLSKIFTNEEFDLTQQKSSNLDYSLVPEQNCIILNELQEIPASLTAALAEFSNNGGSVLIIPSADANTNQYNVLLNVLQLGTLNSLKQVEKNITNIVFEHPIYSDVFEKQVVNFQYPKVNSFYTISSNATPLLKFEDDNPFLLAQKNSYLATAAINNNNSNLKSSPLIVPTFYNIARQSLQLPRLYYTVGTPTTFAVSVSLLQDEIVTLKDSIQQFIPLQQAKANKVIIITNDDPQKAGILNVIKTNTPLKHVSYNYNRNEGELIYQNAEDWSKVTVHNTINNLFQAIKKDNTIIDYWKWFAIMALLFLVAEMLVLKYYKK